MADDKSKRGASDRRRIAANEPYEVGYFARKHGISRQKAEAIINKTGGNREKANADRAEQNMIAAYGAAKAVLRAGEQPVWRILAGRESSPEAAEELAKRIRSEQHEPQAFVVRLDP